MRDRCQAAKKGWARRRLSIYLARVKTYLGFTPDKITVWSEDFDLLCNYTTSGTQSCIITQQINSFGRLIGVGSSPTLSAKYR